MLQEHSKQILFLRATHKDFKNLQRLALTPSEGILTVSQPPKWSLLLIAFMCEINVWFISKVHLPGWPLLTRYSHAAVTAMCNAFEPSFGEFSEVRSAYI